MTSASVNLGPFRRTGIFERNSKQGEFHAVARGCAKADRATSSVGGVYRRTDQSNFRVAVQSCYSASYVFSDVDNGICRWAALGTAELVVSGDRAAAQYRWD